ncbi:DUF2750 domain-containing protein [Volucribacter amazonae]|uniref:DUF2750 domain-containing protein n=1 Tax=Volucribacter amazonae TaxID=256731 RepID=A0A9X4SMJ5_9PAST|nr:DUF2750 domain-containing protein [Volucribacter amazonae]MDG6896203.1 hypothetical protein [Volucribacter amazonae]
MNIKEIESVLSLSKEKLYKTFLLRISDSEKIWILCDKDNILYYGDNDNNQYFPIWPEKEFAEMCAINEWSNSKPVCIELEEFLTEYIPELIDNNIYLSIFPRLNYTETIIFEAKEFAKIVVSYIEEWYGDSFDLPYLEN